MVRKDVWSTGVSTAALIVSLFALLASGTSAYYTYRSDQRAVQQTYPRVDWDISRPEARLYKISFTVENTHYGQIYIERISTLWMTLAKEVGDGGTNELGINTWMANGEKRRFDLVGVVDPLGAAHQGMPVHFELRVSGGSLPKSPFIFAVDRTL